MNDTLHTLAGRDEIIVRMLPKFRDGSQVLDDETLVLPRGTGTLFSRREVLRAGAAGTGAVLLGGFDRRFQPKAEAIEPITMAFLGALITWAVHRVLNSAVERFQVQQQPPAPTNGRCPFHDRWGYPCIVHGWFIPETYSKSNDLQFSLDKYPRARHLRTKGWAEYDYNVRELSQFRDMDKQKEFERFPNPCGERRKPEIKDRQILRGTLKENYPKIDPDEWEAEYGRLIIVDDVKKPKLSYGISNKRKPQEKSLVIVEE